jgi:hypothetical protein
VKRRGATVMGVISILMRNGGQANCPIFQRKVHRDVTDAQ